MNTYPLYMSQKMLFLSKESSLKSSVDTVASALSGLSELTEENVAAAMAVVDMIYNILATGSSTVRKVTFSTQTVNVRPELQKTNARRKKAA